MALIGLDGREVPNGCDWFPDRFLVWDWEYCCSAHDIAYTIGGTDMDRWVAEAEFFGCLASISPLLALVMVPVTFLVGYGLYNLKRRRR
ncbi:MAG: hypothetical protein ACYCZ0_01795 [Minisyncoccota bacterium]